MIKLFKVLIIVTTVMVVSSEGLYAQDPITAVIRAGIKKVIRAVDLKIQRLQDKTLWLQNAQKVLENKMSQLKLTEISEWAEKQRALYADYFDELWKVKNIIAYYNGIKDIEKKQIQIVHEYRRAYYSFKQDKNFLSTEILFMGKFYKGLIDQSLEDLETLGLVVNSFSTQMTDAKRIEIIADVAHNLDEHLDNLRQFNNQNILLSLERAEDREDVEAVKKLYGIE